MTDDLSVTWITAGKKNSDGASDRPNPAPRIDVLESPSSISLEPGGRPYGLAIDAPLAVRMIAQFWIKVQQELPGLFTPPGDDPAVPADPGQSWIRRLLDASFAFTMDKNMVLKTLSQPLCEGLRYYMALKYTDEGTPEQKEWLSLVAVGVDKDGRDLHYEWDPAHIPTSYDQVPTISLVSEYGHPPGRLLALMAGAPDPLDPFVLFKYSQVFSNLGQ